MAQAGLEGGALGSVVGVDPRGEGIEAVFHVGKDGAAAGQEGVGSALSTARVCEAGGNRGFDGGDGCGASGGGNRERER